MKRYFKISISVVLSLIISIGVLFYIYVPHNNVVAAPATGDYADHVIPDSDWLMVDNFEHLDNAPNGGERETRYGWFSSSAGIVTGMKDNIVRAPKGVGMFQIGTDFANPRNGTSNGASLWGGLYYHTPYNLSAYDTIEVHFYMNCSYFRDHPVESFPISVTFTSNGATSLDNGATCTIELSGNTENNKNSKWGKVRFKKTAGSASLANGATDRDFRGSNATNWTAINGISFRRVGNFGDGSQSKYNIMNLYVDYIVAYKSSFQGPTFESFETSAMETSDGNYLSHRIYPSARGWDLDGGFTFVSDNIQEGNHALRLYEPNNIFRKGQVNYSRFWGPQCYIRLKNTIDMREWDKFEIEVYVGTIGSALAARTDVTLNINLISASKNLNNGYGEDDGFNYSIALSNLDRGWNTLTIKKTQFAEATNPITKWQWVDGITFRISSSDTSLVNTLPGVTTGTDWALELIFDDFRGEDTDRLKSGTTSKLTDIAGFNDYGYLSHNLSAQTFTTSKLPDGTTIHRFHMITGATTTAAQNTTSWKYATFFMPTARDLSSAKYIVLTVYPYSIPSSGSLQLNLMTYRYGIPTDTGTNRPSTQDGLNYSAGISSDIKPEVWNKLYLPLSDFAVGNRQANADLSQIRRIRFSYVDHQGQTLNWLIGDISFTSEAINENTMPVVDSFYSGSSTASKRSHYSYCTTSKVYNSSTYSKAFVDENGKTLLAKDNNYVQCVTSSGTMNETYSGSGHFVNSHIYLQYKKPKDFTPYSTIEIDMYSTKDFSGVDGTFEINFTAGDFMEYPNGYDIRLTLSNIKSGWNRLRLSRYYLQNVGGPREGNERTTLENAALADWRNITGISISVYIIKRGVSTLATTPMTLAIDTIYATNHTYHNAAKPVYSIIDEMYTQLTTGWNSPNQFYHATLDDHRDRYEDLLDEIDAINNNKTWLTKTYPPTYYGDSYPNGITTPQKVNDGYDYKLLNVIPPEYQTKLDFIQMELEKNYSMSLSYKTVAGSQYTPLSTATSSNVSITSDSSYTVQIDLTMAAASKAKYYSGTLTGGIDPILYLTLTGETGHRNFPVNTVLTLRRQNGSNYENYKLRITNEIASAGGSVKFSQFSLETATSGAAKWSEYKNSFPARGSTTTWLLIVDYSECAAADRLGANTYLTNIWISETDTVSGSTGNTYRTVLPYTYISNARTHSLTAGISGGTNVSSTQTFNQNSKMTVSGNMTVGSVTTVSGASDTATDVYNTGRTCTIVGTLHNSSGTQINIPKGTTVTSKLGGSSKNATIRVGKYIYTGYALSSTSAATTAYSFDINLATASELLSAGTYTLKVAMYNGYDSTHPFSGKLIDTKTLTFKIVRNEFYATIPNTETLVDLSKASNILNLTTSAGLVSNAKAQIELQKKGVDGAYSTVAISGKYSIASTYATADSNGTSYTLTSSGLNATFPVTLTSSGLTAGSTYRLRFTMTNTDGSKTYHYAGFVTAK